MKVWAKLPPLRFLVSHPAHLIACGFGSGLSPVAPGTVGSVFALLTFPLLRAAMNDAMLLVFLAACFVLGIFCAGRTARDLGDDDPGCVVWDEIVPLWLILVFCPLGWRWQGAAFLLFRFFDIVKPQPARFFDEKVKNGFGIMTDDLFAALYALGILLTVKWYL